MKIIKTSFDSRKDVLTREKIRQLKSGSKSLSLIYDKIKKLKYIRAFTHHHKDLFAAVFEKND